MQQQQKYKMESRTTKSLLNNNNNNNNRSDHAENEWSKFRFFLGVYMEYDEIHFRMSYKYC